MCIIGLRRSFKGNPLMGRQGCRQGAADYSPKIRNDEIRFQEFRNDCLVFAGFSFSFLFLSDLSLFVSLSSQTTNFSAFLSFLVLVIGARHSP